MTNKIFLIRMLIGAVMILILGWDMMSAQSLRLSSLPHRDLLLTGALLWIITLFFPQERDDDWAGQF